MEPMPSCGECRYFGVADPAAVTPMGICRRHAPHVAGWPATDVNNWCGDWIGRDQLNGKVTLDTLLARLDGLGDRLKQMDERMTAVEFSVTAAQLEITRQEL